ncbi:actin binding protein-like protein [Cucurbitaria berberidis CBS 394.84]|uniref:Actin binding protein-like protein n=1 Tax=Cucurbitaria berberidis CBS 394.84 TaxID=1168544 RepID=A0A9P4GBY1_9PLEO|nr:actin binding protein-like protein [Cucurbitaria berberidis CBS 394.84]KAF1842699.1 actin binding protein-like protein [Cucurbitaria berberidis CBS 394.84]
MASLNTSSNGPNITRSYQNVVNSPPPSGAQASSPTYGQWAVFAVAAPLVSAFQQDGGKESVLKVQSTGEGELLDLVDEFSDGRIQFAFVKVKDPNTSLPKNVLIAWCGEGVPERTKGYFGSHLTVVSKLLHGYHVQVTARSDADLTPERIIQKVSDASGAKYSGGPNIPSSSGPPPPAAKKPVFTPTHVGGGGSGFNPLGRSRAPAPNANEDADGWGADAPQVQRSQLEKVQSAYKPTKVNMAELTSNKDESTRSQPSQSQSDRPEVVRGAYQPVGKVDIAAIRAQAREKQDDRPTVVKGAYEPIGKVDIAAIRAKAQVAPSPSGNSPAATPASGDDEEDRPRSLAERSSAFSSQPERLTSLPKPKVANKFAGASSFTGTKAPTPSAFGVKPAAPAPIVGAASKTFADEGGKTPAQIWAEKKAARGESPKSSADAGGRPAPLQNQQSGGGGWQSGYAGKSWAPVQTTRTGQSVASNLSEQRTGGEPQQQEPASPPSGAVSSLKDRFAGAVPMGAPTSRAIPEPSDPSPPALDTSSKPNAGARGVPIPGLPSRPREPESDEDHVPAVQHQRVPSPPRQQRSPSPEPSGSPVRIAMPVARGKEPDHLSPAAEQAPPMPTRSLDQAARQARDISPERQVEAKDPARSAGAAVAAATFGGAVVAGAAVGAAVASGHDDQGGAGQRGLIQYDYEKAEDNEVELREGEYVTDIDMVDEDWWMGTNSEGERGLFPANYVELVEDDDAGATSAPPLPTHPTAAQEPEPSHSASGAGPTATAIYDYDAAEENELSFPEGATITGVEFPDEDWWLGNFNGKSGLFPANYVQLDE